MWTGWIKRALMTLPGGDDALFQNVWEKKRLLFDGRQGVGDVVDYSSARLVAAALRHGWQRKCHCSLRGQSHERKCLLLRSLENFERPYRLRRAFQWRTPRRWHTLPYLSTLSSASSADC